MTVCVVVKKIEGFGKRYRKYSFVRENGFEPVRSSTRLHQVHKPLAHNFGVNTEVLLVG